MTQIEIDTVLNEMVRKIVERFQPEKIILFGSYARGEFTEDSDFDFLIVMPVENSQRQKANEIDLALADRTIPIDIIVVTPEQYESRKNLIGTIIHVAAHEGRIVYDRAA
ncbi:MAG: nucleotidyltransferase domain-containing protein [Candidatus Latescibacterota bacterium]